MGGIELAPRFVGFAQSQDKYRALYYQLENVIYKLGYDDWESTTRFGQVLHQPTESSGVKSLVHALVSHQAKIIEFNDSQGVVLSIKRK